MLITVQADELTWLCQVSGMHDGSDSACFHFVFGWLVENSSRLLKGYFGDSRWNRVSAYLAVGPGNLDLKRFS